MQHINIIFEDNHLLVAEKPPNMLSQGDSTGDTDLLSILKSDIKRRYGKPGNVFLGLVHRLDRPAGGVMVFARTSKAASRLSEQIRNGVFEKTYLAVVRGVPENPAGRLEDYLVKDGETNTVKVVEPANGAKKAVLEYETMESSGGLSLVRINLLTGRPHQIRVQFASSGYPLFGDHKYGKTCGKADRLALWSHKIEIIHPTLKQPVIFTSLPPAEYPWNLFNCF